MFRFLTNSTNDLPFACSSLLPLVMCTDVKAGNLFKLDKIVLKMTQTVLK
jgi:hypothetical protein